MKGSFPLRVRRFSFAVAARYWHIHFDPPQSASNPRYPVHPKPPCRYKYFFSSLFLFYFSSRETRGTCYRKILKRMFFHDDRCSRDIWKLEKNARLRFRICSPLNCAKLRRSKFSYTAHTIDQRPTRLSRDPEARSPVTSFPSPLGSNFIRSEYPKTVTLENRARSLFISSFFVPRPQFTKRCTCIYVVSSAVLSQPAKPLVHRALYSLFVLPSSNFRRRSFFIGI